MIDETNAQGTKEMTVPDSAVPMADNAPIAVERRVRDNCSIFDPGSTFYTIYDWPFIEEVKAYVAPQCPSIVLLMRNTYDFISATPDHLDKCWTASPEERAKPTSLDTVSYGSDITGLEIPFDPNAVQALMYSESEEGMRMFTMSLGSPYTGPVQLMGGEDRETGKNRFDNVKVWHFPAPSIVAMIGMHLINVSRAGNLIEPIDLHEKAIACLDDLMYFSRHVC